jgi:glutamate formiminotransferase
MKTVENDVGAIGHIFLRSLKRNDFDVNVDFKYLGWEDVLTFLPLTKTEREKVMKLAREIIGEGWNKHYPIPVDSRLGKYILSLVEKPKYKVKILEEQIKVLEYELSSVKSRKG